MEEAQWVDLMELPDLNRVNIEVSSALVIYNMSNMKIIPQNEQPNLSIFGLSVTTPSYERTGRRSDRF